jgi:hypothetical protein
MAPVSVVEGPCQNSSRSDRSHHSSLASYRNTLGVAWKIQNVRLCFSSFAARRQNIKFLRYPQNAWIHYFFPTKCCRLPKFIRIDCYLSSFSAVIHTSYVSCFLDVHSFCGMHDAIAHLLSSWEAGGFQKEGEL